MNNHDLIRQLLQTRDAENADLAEDIIETALRLLDEKMDRRDIRVIASAVKELRYSSKVFAPYRGRRKVTVFGSARTRPDQVEYQQAVEFGKAIVKRGFMVITGGGEGIMGAAQRGAGRGDSFGLNIRLPFEQEPNEEIAGDKKLVSFKYFFTRKLCFMKESDAIALFPGGFGTHDEGFEVLTLVQTGKGRPMPIVFVDSPRGTFWKTWLRYVHDHLLRHNLISRDDLALFKVTTSVEEAVGEVTGFYRVYHSSRMVGPDFVVRLTRPLRPALVKGLSRDFKDILFTGEIVQTDALPAEREQEPELDGLSRLVFRLVQGRAGRLRQLIDRLNREG
jgi:hypothetical protein